MEMTKDQEIRQRLERLGTMFIQYSEMFGNAAAENRGMKSLGKRIFIEYRENIQNNKTAESVEELIEFIMFWHNRITERCYCQVIDENELFCQLEQQKEEMFYEIIQLHRCLV